MLASGRPGPMCVPVLQGFGSPSWDAGARGAVLGLELGTTRADLARAVVDGIVHQVADAVEAIGTLDTLRIDGGLSRSNWTAQRLADLAGVRVQRTARPDSTALGAAMLAGLAAGVWDDLDAVPEVPVDLVAEPALSDAERAAERERWAAARGARCRVALRNCGWVGERQGAGRARISASLPALGTDVGPYPGRDARNPLAPYPAQLTSYGSLQSHERARPPRRRRPEGPRGPGLGPARQPGLRAQHRRADRALARARTARSSSSATTPSSPTRRCVRRSPATRSRTS